MMECVICQYRYCIVLYNTYYDFRTPKSEHTHTHTVSANALTQLNTGKKKLKSLQRSRIAGYVIPKVRTYLRYNTYFLCPLCAATGGTFILGTYKTSRSTRTRNLSRSARRTTIHPSFSSSTIVPSMQTFLQRGSSSPMVTFTSSTSS